ncbi:MAG: response regulator, partial [Acidobacteria bacterium]|nr:response regulator [Acidobacteriota bacterium]
DPQAAVEARRELHTLKGAGRMMRFGAFAELCHAAEELLHGLRAGALATAGLIPLLTRVLDRLSGMVDVVRRGGADPAADAELLALLAVAVPGAGGGAGSTAAVIPAASAAAAAGSAAAVTPAAPAATAVPAAAPAVAGAPAAIPGGSAAPEAAFAAPAGADAPEAGSAAPAATAAFASPAVTPPPPPPRLGGAGDLRVDSRALDTVAERAMEVRILALAARPAAERLYELARLAEEGVREPQPGQVLSVLAAMLRRAAMDVESGQRRLLHAAEEQLDRMLKLQLQPLRGSLLALARYAREIGRSLKREVEVTVEGEDTRLDRRIARELEEALLHLVRNAVDHGIEAAEVREARGKPRAGRIRLRAAAAGAKVRLEIADDGTGVDVKRLRQQAVQAGLLDEAAAGAASHDEILRLLFAPGFSTRRRVSETSGRGVGLDVVAAAVSRAGGEVFLISEPRRGTTVAIEVPVARRGEHVLLLAVGALRLALPSAVVRRATRLDHAAVIERDGRSFARLPGRRDGSPAGPGGAPGVAGVAERAERAGTASTANPAAMAAAGGDRPWDQRSAGEEAPARGERLVAFVPLARLYGQTPAEHQVLLEGQVSGQPLALVVDDVLREQEVLVRPITRKVATDHLLEGVALLASGEPVGVLSPAVLAQRDYLRALPVAAARAVRQRVRVLLVEDSLVTREMERRLLEDAGFEVAAAADAAEALSRLGEETFDCVVTDVEMAEMDGFELTSQLRGMEHFAHLPIVVVSTRDRPEDRLR